MRIKPNGFHFNPRTGATGLCFAERCPLLKPDEHYETAKMASEAFAEYMKKQGHSNVASHTQSGASELVLGDLFDTELLNYHINNGNIAVRTHNDDQSLKILCYTPTVQQRGVWDDVTTTARGLIVRADNPNYSDAVVVARPWRKFFTLNQLNDNSWVLGDEEREGDSVEAELARIDFNAPVEVTDKVDGSLGILYVAPDGLPALSTKGSFHSAQADYYTNLIRDDEEKFSEMSKMSQNGNTYLFELVGRDNRIVLDYDKTDVILLGGVNVKTGEYLSISSASKGWSGAQAEIMTARTVGEAFALPDRKNREGVVIRVLSKDHNKQMQLKVKQEDYKTLARVLDNFSGKLIREHLRSDEATIGSLLRANESGDVSQVANLNKILNPTVDNIDEKLLNEVLIPRKNELSKQILPRIEKLSRAREYINQLPESEVSPDLKKEFAAKVQNIEDLEKSDLFLMYDARSMGLNVDEIPAERFLRNLAKGLNL